MLCIKSLKHRQGLLQVNVCVVLLLFLQRAVTIATRLRCPHHVPHIVSVCLQGHVDCMTACTSLQAMASTRAHIYTCTQKHAHTQTHAHTQRHTQPHTQACTCACMNCIFNVCLSTCSICIVPIGTDYLCQAKFIQPLSGQYTKSLSLRLINS